MRFIGFKNKIYNLNELKSVDLEYDKGRIVFTFDDDDVYAEGEISILKDLFDSFEDFLRGINRHKIFMSENQNYFDLSYHEIMIKDQFMRNPQEGNERTR